MKGIFTYIVQGITIFFLLQVNIISLQAQIYDYYKSDYKRTPLYADYIITRAGDTIYCQISPSSLKAIQKKNAPWWSGYYEIEVLLAGTLKKFTPKDIKGYYKSSDHTNWESGFYESKYLPFDKEQYNSQWFSWDESQEEYMFMRREIDGVCNYYTVWRRGQKSIIYHIFIQKQNEDIYMIKKIFLFESASVINLARNDLARYLKGSETFTQDVLLNEAYKIKNNEEFKQVIILYNESFNNKVIYAESGE